MKKILCMAMAIIMTLVLAVAGVAETPEWPRDLVIGFAVLDASHEHLIPVGENIAKVAAEYAEELGINIKVIQADNASDGMKAIEVCDNLLLQNIDVFVEFNVDAAINETIWEKCQEAGVPVMAVDIPVGEADNSEVDPEYRGTREILWEAGGTTPQA